GEGSLERRQLRPEREPLRAQHLEDQLLLAPTDERAGEGNERVVHATPARRARWCCERPGSMPASSESTSASQLASMMFSETPIDPQVSWPSLASSRTRVTAPVPLVSSRMRTLKFTSWMSRRWG